MKEIDIIERIQKYQNLQDRTIKKIFSIEELKEIELIYQNNYKEVFYYLKNSDKLKSCLCVVCNKPCNYFQLKRAVIENKNPHCQISCGNKDPYTLEKYTKTCLERYNEINPSKQEIVKNKIRKTNLERYGVDWQFKRPDVIEKCIKTKKENNSYQKAKENYIKTCLGRYNEQSHMKVDSMKIKQVKNKFKNKNKYPNRHILYNMLDYYKEPFTYKTIEEISKLCKVSKVHVKNICVEQNIKFIKYTEDDELKKDVISKSRESLIENNFQYINYDYLESIKSSNYLTRYEYDKAFILSGYKHISQFNNFLRENNIDFEYKRIIKQFELQDFISQIYKGKILINPRGIIGTKQTELDIYIPEKNLAIEFNGNYWHSISRKNKDYHLNKTNLCEQKGIRLIHIWESEWINNQDYCKYVIQSYISNKLPKIDQNKLSRDYFSVLDFPDSRIEEPSLEKSGNFDVYKTGYILI